MKRNLTILDVAQAAGVSTATVSRALNGGKISLKAQRAVRRAVQDLGYQRNTLARGLVTGKTGVIGVLVPDVLGPLYAQMARGIEDVLTPLGMQYTLVTSSRDVSREQLATQFLLEQQVDGLILIGSQMGAEALRPLVASRTQAVLVQREALTSQVDLCAVELDNPYGVEAALTHLLSLGHRHIAHIAGVRRDGAARLAAYHQVLEGAGIAARYVFQGNSTEASGISAARELLAFPEITAVLCSNDRVALGLYHALRGQSRCVPQSISVVGFDDLPWGEYVSPPLTTVRQPGREMGRLAARCVLDARAGSAPPETVLVRPELVVRASVADLRGGEAGLPT